MFRILKIVSARLCSSIWALLNMFPFLVHVIFKGSTCSVKIHVTKILNRLISTAFALSNIYIYVNTYTQTYKTVPWGANSWMEHKSPLHWKTQLELWRLGWGTQSSWPVAPCLLLPKRFPCKKFKAPQSQSPQLFQQ